MHVLLPIPQLLPGGISPSYILDNLESKLVFFLCNQGADPKPRGLIGEVSDVVHLGLMKEFLGVSGPPVPFKPDALVDGFKADARTGKISLANSLTKMGPSSLLSFATISYRLYHSTSIVRFGWTSQTVRRIQSKFS